MRRLARMRSALFAPASDARLLAKARASAADAVIADLEDAVAHGEKAAAREVLRTVLSEPREAGVQLVRINALSTPDADADLVAVASVAVDGIVVPKAEPESLRGLRVPAPVVALVETARGLREAWASARVDGVEALMIGTVDLAAELGARPDLDERALLHARSSLVVDAAAAGLGAPLDGVCTAIADGAALRREAQLARALGFGGKACIHPAQLPIVHEVFTPSAEEERWARGVLEASERAAREGRGATTLDGQMIDAAVVARARALLPPQ